MNQTYSKDLDTIIRVESDGYDEDLDDQIEYAAALVRTGLVNTTGSYQRFVAAVASGHPEELHAAILAGYTTAKEAP